MTSNVTGLLVLTDRKLDPAGVGSDGVKGGAQAKQRQPLDSQGQKASTRPCEAACNHQPTCLGKNY